MQIAAQILTCRRMAGKARNSGRDYNLLIVNAILEGRDGPEVVEFMLDGAHPDVQPGRHALTVTPYPGKDKRLAFRVDEAKPVPAGAKAVA